MFRLVSPAAAIAAAVLCMAPVAARAAEAADAPPAAVQAKVDAFMTSLKAGKVSEAYTQAFAGTLMSKKQAELEQAVAGTENGLRYYGALRDWQLVGTSRPADGFVVAVYMARLESAPLFMRFQAYDNGAKWIVYNIIFSDNYDTMKGW
ncbi:hypothetical protein [Caulobacter sp. FWC2]|uniref:hypothetical protein n=1 Tax=Caulobacter sp. FWC2 TaxID=69664 RepID=UPI000C145E69|nr:hypothetical protein [Caulobacter sp. FWC2]PIB93715.1 hypothetical protein CSW62_20330 [Caulobacter sp. FWC2]